MNGELNILGVFVPALLIYALVAFGLKEVACRLLLRWEVYRFVWHRPLFDTALFIVLLGAIVWFIH